MQKKRVLVTGAAGFIGFHLAKALGERGDFALGVDNFIPYYDPSLKLAREKELKKRGIHILHGDICDKEKLLKTIEENKITHIAHLAAQAGVRYSLTHPEAFVKSNLEGFASLLEVCRKNPHIPLVYASSSSVYGKNEKIPFSIDDPVEKPASFYGATKRSNELMAASYHNLFGLSVTGLRFFTVYGPWGRPDMAYFSFTKAILEGRPIDVYNHGKLERDFTYIDDIIQGTLSAIDKEGRLELYNLGNHKPISLENFITTLEESLGKKAIRKNVPMQPGDVHRTFADISKSEQALQFSPKTDLKRGLKEFVAWYLEYYPHETIR